ncbi:MAG: hypothetical protein HYW33_03525 [Candidatus Blackburnbacteria bacterium]|nr:hypothetical protein [Candidatus Blackburnbacteria bacterium]
MIKYTKHASGKFVSLEKAGFVVKRVQVRATILNPESGPTEGRFGTKIVVKCLNKDHSLRVIYVQSNDIITVITFYPVEKGRYEQKKN